MPSLRALPTVLLLVAALPLPARALPAWARRYNMNCSGCHSPAVPRLNATGIAFKWAGYRMPDDIGTAVEVKKIENYLAAKVIAAYDNITRTGGVTEASGFSIPSASFYAAGPLGKNFGSYLEFERLPDATVDVVGSLLGVWGSEKQFGGFRVGQGHTQYGAGGVAGFDRPTGISTPLAYEEPLMESVPVIIGRDQAGLEAFLVVGGRDRMAVQLLNGVLAGAGMLSGAVAKQDIILSNQLMWDDAGSGLGLSAYLGSAKGLVRGQPEVGRQFYRLSATANKIVDRFELLGGFVYGKDVDVPVADTMSTATRSPTGQSYWMQGNYTLKQNPLTLYGRYEFLEPDRSAADASHERYVVGAVLPLNVPEYLRWSIELFRDSYRSAATPQRQGLSTQLQVAF